MLHFVTVHLLQHAGALSSPDLLSFSLCFKSDITPVQCVVAVIITPPPEGGRGTVFVRFLCLSATLQENGWTDLHEIFREGVE